MHWVLLYVEVSVLGVPGVHGTHGGHGGHDGAHTHQHLAGDASNGVSTTTHQEVIEVSVLPLVGDADKRM